jgi:hypothetical protein
MSLLKKIDFGNEAGDDADPQELTSYFVEQSMFREFVDPSYKVLIATAKKGVGKSALIQWLNFRIETVEPDSIVVKCRGADLARGRFNLDNSLDTPNDHIRDWMIRICAIINRTIASKINLALTDDSITLVESAELDGFKSRNFVGCLLDRFSRLLKEFQPTKIHAAEEVELLKRVSNRRLWILIDDLDATFQKTPAECMALGTFFSACRYLTQDVADVCFRITMRTDVWPIVRRYDEAQDKTEQYVREIIWEQFDFRKLLYKRIKSQANILNIPLPSLPAYMEEEQREETLLKLAFVSKMPWGDGDAYTYRVIYTLSYHRPRWAIQLCKLAQKCALKNGDELISKSHIDDVWGDYGQKRIADLVAEHKHQCSCIEELINAFRGCERLLSRQNLLAWITNRITNHITPVIEGKETRVSIDVAYFLYRIGFIVARSEEDDDSYEHYHFSEMPDFLTSRTNVDFNVKWEIHPCYRQALDIQKINRSQRIKKGLKPKPRATPEKFGKVEAIDRPPATLVISPNDEENVLVDLTRADSSVITPKSLAIQLGKKTSEIMAVLVGLSVFISNEHPLDESLVEKVKTKFGSN